jgi:bifunctional ADP-heptose synthase (sugar kinase/adenylyltransferase)
VRSQPGAAGTVVNNLAALGVGRIVPIAIIGDDGEGYELRQALAKMPAVDPSCILARGDRRTPTYTKPMYMEPDKSPRELNRLDIKNRTPTPYESVRTIIQTIDSHFHSFDAVIVLDQVSEEDCGVVTADVRNELGRIAAANPDKFILADSRERIGSFRDVSLKPNRRECLQAGGGGADVAAAAQRLAHRCRRNVFCTSGEDGIVVAEADSPFPYSVAAYPVRGPIDPVGAGDSVSAALACAKASRLGDSAAAAFANLVASITVQQIGTTGTATPNQVRARWQEIQAGGELR